MSYLLADIDKEKEVLLEYLKLASKLEEKIDDKRLLLKEICQRDSCKYLKKDSIYYPGGYLDTDSTDYFEKCSLCGYYKLLENVNHGSYG